MLDVTTTNAAQNGAFLNKSYCFTLQTHTMKIYHNQLKIEEQKIKQTSDTLTSKEDSGGD
jgi:hypothetical protein